MKLTKGRTSHGGGHRGSRCDHHSFKGQIHNKRRKLLLHRSKHNVTAGVFHQNEKRLLGHQRLRSGSSFVSWKTNNCKTNSSTKFSGTCLPLCPPTVTNTRTTTMIYTPEHEEEKQWSGGGSRVWVFGGRFALGNPRHTPMTSTKKTTDGINQRKKEALGGVKSREWKETHSLTNTSYDDVGPVFDCLWRNLGGMDGLDGTVDLVYFVALRWDKLSPPSSLVFTYNTHRH